MNVVRRAQEGTMAGLIDPTKLPKFTDPFGGLKLNETRTVGSFTGTNTGGMTIVRGVPSAAGAMDSLRLGGMTPEQAAATVTAATAADLTKAKTGVVVPESDAQVALQRAQAFNATELAKQVAADAAAQRAALGAQALANRSQAGVYDATAAEQRASTAGMIPSRRLRVLGDGTQTNDVADALKKGAISQWLDGKF